MSFEANILADAISPDGVRLTSFEVEYPHAIHKDIMTHRVLSRSFKSFRAFPPEKVIENIKVDPFVPESFDYRIAGMGQGYAITDQDRAHEIWFEHIDTSIKVAKAMMRLDLAKAQVNFVLQDLTWIRGIITATEWDNFWALRAAPENVRPEVKKIASMMHEAYQQSEPVPYNYGRWTLPLISNNEFWSPIDQQSEVERWKKVSAGRCARVSYLTHDGIRDPARDVELHDDLGEDHHMSPFEHIARPFSRDEWETIRELQFEISKTLQLPKSKRDEMCRQVEFSGNFRGWHQYRKDIPNEHDFSLVQEAA